MDTTNNSDDGELVDITSSEFGILATHRRGASVTFDLILATELDDHGE